VNGWDVPLLERRIDLGNGQTFAPRAAASRARQRTIAGYAELQREGMSHGYAPFARCKRIAEMNRNDNIPGAGYVRRSKNGRAPLRDEARASPASLVILMNVSMHMVWT